MASRTVALAYSGGLDTSYCILQLREKHGAEVVAVTVDTGGFQPGELDEIARRARALGAARHVAVDAREPVYRDFVSYVIKGNILRGEVYPLSVAAERVQQAIEVARVARDIGATAVAHGSTGAGNDQVRFDVAFHVLLPGVPVLTPIRDEGTDRKAAAEVLRSKGFAVDDSVRDYSVNVSLWGTTIGGRETHDTWAEVPERVYRLSVAPDAVTAPPVEIVLTFERGLPVAIDGERVESGPELVARLNRIAGAQGVGRGIHIGDTNLGIKGRIAFEAPAAICLIRAHRELEKLTLTKWQQFWKDEVARFYGAMLHEGNHFDPSMRDIEALIDRSQEKVSGDVRLRLARGRIDVPGARSPHSLVAPEVARYGEASAFYDGRDARGFSKLWGLQSILAARRTTEGMKGGDPGHLVGAPHEVRPPS